MAASAPSFYSSMQRRPSPLRHTPHFPPRPSHRPPIEGATFRARDPRLAGDLQHLRPPRVPPGPVLSCRTTLPSPVASQLMNPHGHDGDRSLRRSSIIQVRVGGPQNKASPQRAESPHFVILPDPRTMLCALTAAPLKFKSETCLSIQLDSVSRGTNLRASVCFKCLFYVTPAERVSEASSVSSAP